MKRLKGIDLIFISQIKRDGSGVKKRISKDYKISLNKETFNIIPLSMTEKTFIAYGFNLFVVKIKEL